MEIQDCNFFPLHLPVRKYKENMLPHDNLIQTVKRTRWCKEKFFYLWKDLELNMNLWNSQVCLIQKWSFHVWTRLISCIHSWTIVLNQYLFSSICTFLQQHTLVGWCLWRYIVNFKSKFLIVKFLENINSAWHYRLQVWNQQSTVLV